MEPAIEIVNLCKQFNQGTNKILAVNNLNLRIMYGELVSIIGRSGSGKSTLLNLLGGIDVATSGEIIIANKSLSKMSDNELTKFRSKNIGIVFQNFNLIQELNVLENICLPLDLTNQQRDIPYINSLIETLELGDRLTHSPSQLSGGQQQRVAIARALVTRPKIVLADEPTGSLDKKTGEAIFEYIQNANRALGQTFIIVTHNEEIARRSTRIITLDDGCITSDRLCT